MRFITYSQANYITIIARVWQEWNHNLVSATNVKISI